MAAALLSAPTRQAWAQSDSVALIGTPVAPLHAGTGQHASLLSRTPGLAVAAVSAATSTHVIGTPKAWDRRWGGYGRRVADQAGFITVEETTRLSLERLTGWGPDERPCHGRASPARWRSLVPRLGCAVRESFVLRTPAGRPRPNLPLLAGAGTAAAASTLWRPDAQTTSQAVSLAITRTAVTLGATVVAHLIADWRKDGRRR